MFHAVTSSNFGHWSVNLYRNHKTSAAPQERLDSAPKTSRKAVSYFLRLTIGIVLLAYVLNKYSAATILVRLIKADLKWLIAAGVLAYTGILLSSLKWKYILDSYERRISIWRLFKLYLEAGFFNLFFPSFIAGDLSRIARTSAGSTPSVEETLAVFLERFSGLLVACSYICVFALQGAYRELGQFWDYTILVIGASTLVGFVLLLKIQWIKYTVWFVPKLLRRRIDNAMEKITSALRKVTDSPRLLYQLTAFSLLFILTMVGASYCVARSIDFPVPATILLAYAPLTSLLVSLPISIAGLGVRENLWVIFLSALGFLPETIIAFSLLYSALMLFVRLSGGIVFLLPLLRSSEKSPLM
jgi:uncharacterized membrane protein YbhN (UPF0104 family)